MDPKEFEALMAKRKAKKVQSQSVGSKVIASSDDVAPVESDEGLGSKALGVGSAMLRAPLQIKEVAKGIPRAGVSIATAPVEGLDLASRISEYGGGKLASAVTGVSEEGLAASKQAELESDTLSGKISRFQEAIRPKTVARGILKRTDALKEWGPIASSDRVKQGWGKGVYDPEWWAGNIAEAGAYTGFFMHSAQKYLKKNATKQMAVLANKQSSKTAIAKARKEVAKMASKSVMAKAATVEGMMSHGEYRQWEKKNPDDATLMGDAISTAFGALAGSVEGWTAGSMIMRPFIKKFGKTAGTKAATNFMLEVAKAGPRNILKEGGTEVFQEYLANIGKKYGYEPDQDLYEGLIEAGILGGTIGGGFSVYEAKATTAGKDKAQKDFIALKKSQGKINSLSEKINRQQEIYNDPESSPAQKEKALDRLDYLDTNLQKQEAVVDEMASRIKGEIDPKTGEPILPALKDESGEVVVSDKEAFGDTIDPSLTVEDIATGIDSGEISKAEWDNTDKGIFTDEQIEVINEHIEEKQNIEDIETLAAGGELVDRAVDEKGIELDQEDLSGTGKRLWQQLPENYTDEDAVVALETDMATSAEATGLKPPKVTLSKTAGKNSEVVGQLSDILGVRIVRVDMEDTESGTFNGVMSNADDKLFYINSKSERPEVWIMGHEFGHSLKKSNPEAYNVLLEVASQEIDPKEVSRYRKQQDETLGLEKGTSTIDTAVEDMLGDFMGDRFSNPEFWAKVHKNNPSKFKEIITTVRDYIKNIMDNFTGQGVKADKFFSDMVKLDDTLADVINKHVGYTGAITQLQEGEVDTREVKDLNKDNKHMTSIQLGDTGTMMIRESKDTIRIHRLSRTGSRRGTLAKNLVKDSVDKGTPTAALNELKAYAKENNKTIVAEVSGNNEYLANQNFESTGVNMIWKPGNDEIRREADKIEADKDTLSRDLETVTATLERTDLSESERADTELKLRELLDKKRGVGPLTLADATETPRTALRKAKEEETELIKTIQEDRDTLYSTTSRESIVAIKEDMAKNTARMEELNDIIETAEGLVTKEVIKEEEDVTEKGKQVRGDGQQRPEGVRDAQDTAKGKKTDSGDRDIESEKGKEVIDKKKGPVTIKKGDTLVQKIEEVKKEAEYKKQGVRGKLNRIANILDMDGMHGDIPAFMTHVQKEGIDPKAPENERIFQEVLSKFVRSEEAEAAPIKKKKPKAKKKTVVRTTKERIELGVLQEMMSEQMSGSMPKAGTEEYTQRVVEITDDVRLRVQQENKENNSIQRKEKAEDIAAEMKFSAEPLDPKSSIKGVDERTEKAETLATRSLGRRLKDTATATVKSFRSPVSELVPGKYGYAKDRIRLAKEVDKFGSREAFRRIYKVVNKLNPDEQKVFTMNLILSDMIFDTAPNENGVALLKDGHLPFGYKTVANVRKDLRHFREQARKSPRIMVALARRRKMMGALRDKLIKRGFISKDLANNDAYFHHLTLEKLAMGDDYMFGVYRKAGDKDVSWAHERGGNITAYSTDYIVSEFSVVSNAIATMELSRIKDQLRAKYDITSDLEKKAGSKVIEPPKGFTTFIPSQRLGWGASPSFPDAVVDNVLQQAKIDPEVKRKMQVASGVTETWIIPEKLANGLSRIREVSHEGMPEKISNSITQAWKKWVLINPVRVVGYNIRNMAGDVDIAMAYDWNIMRYTKQAMADLAGDIESTGTRLPFNLQRYGTKLSAEQKVELKEAHRLGVIGAGFVMHEVTDIAGEFEALMRGPQGNAAKKFGMNWWQASKDATNYRENILRLASYRYFKDRLLKGEPGIYGASNPAEVDEITNLNEKAAKLSRELIGDYGRLSESGEWVRKHLIPFYSWMEINAPRYVRMMKNLKHEGGSKKAAVGMTWKASVLGAKFYAFTAMVTAWNSLMFGDDEEDLKGYQKKNMHLLLGRRADGSIRYLPLQGAFRDALSWFGGENAYYDIQDYKNGDTTPMEMVKKTVSAAPLKFYTGSRPFFRAGTELWYGSTMFPDPHNPRPINDKWEYVSKTFSADIIYRMARGKATRGMAAELRNKLFYNVSEGESAYYEIRDKVNKYNKKVGYIRPTVIPAKEDTIGTKRRYALRNYKKALKLVDIEATEKFLKMYWENDGTRAGLTSSFKLSKPTGGLRKKNRSGFYKTLSKEDKELLNTASKWYRNTYDNFVSRPAR